MLGLILDDLGKPRQCPADSQYNVEIQLVLEDGFPPVRSHSNQTKLRYETMNMIIEYVSLTLPMHKPESPPRFGLTQSPPSAALEEFKALPQIRY